LGGLTDERNDICEIEITGDIETKGLLRSREAIE